MRATSLHHNKQIVISMYIQYTYELMLAVQSHYGPVQLLDLLRRRIPAFQAQIESCCPN